MQGSINDIQLDTTAYVGVRTSAQVGYLGGLSVVVTSSVGRWSPRDIGRKLTRTASSHMRAMVMIATRRVTQRPYLLTKI